MEENKIYYATICNIEGEETDIIVTKDYKKAIKSYDSIILNEALHIYKCFSYCDLNTFDEKIKTLYCKHI